MTCSGEGRACDLSTQFTAFISTMICRMAISTTSLCEVNDANGIYGLVKEFVELAAKLSLGEVLGPLRKLDLFGYGKRIQEVVAWFDQVVEGIMKEHEENFEGRTKDMMDILLQVYRDPNAEIKLTRKNIKSFFLDFFLAGTDTSAVTLQWTMAEIINHPQVLNKLRAEMDSVLGSTRLVNESDVPNLPYLQAVVKEVLRLHPAIPVNVREPAEDCIVNGYDLKAHTRVMFNFYAIMRDPEVWPNPDKFIPERFLVNRSEINGRDQLVMDKKGQDFTYIPFGRGRRGCPGESLALTVIHATVGALIQCFDWKIDGGYKVNMEEGSGFSLVLAKPLVVHPITRFNPF
ncbi:hypothetical protein L6164_033275 [Bauhinia variegata]|uniref:Uncharacterized protein n=1 Tax=Bauhinia variegata TaxID=167791 RepID=A0ACB9KRM2_BAUVA|nr:hypothetical protein L6164_033275 [Bauhinia variegata]